MRTNNAKPSTISSASHVTVELIPSLMSWFRRAYPAALAGIALSLAGCASVPKPPASEASNCPQPTEQTPAPPSPQLSWTTALHPSSWDALAGWTEDELSAVWPAFLRTCQALQARPAWQAACASAGMIQEPDSTTIRTFFEQNFRPYQVANLDGTDEGTITGYYEPLIRGSRVRSATYRFPVYGVPDDLLVVDLSALYPELRSMRLRGRLEGRRVVPYHARAEIASGKIGLDGRELLWTDDAVELFFLQIQGSGKVQLDTGEIVRLSYADQNGYPYRSVGRLLVERGELTLDQASMQGIKAWGVRHPERLADLLNENGSYVFFHETPATADGPTGALGVPLTAGRSVAVDPLAIPLGAPVFVATTRPNSSTPLNRLMVAQDTGGAIKGAVRADFFWGSGEEAGAQAGRMRQSGRLWVLLPAGFPLVEQ